MEKKRGTRKEKGQGGENKMGEEGQGKIKVEEEKRAAATTSGRVYLGSMTLTTLYTRCHCVVGTC